MRADDRDVFMGTLTTLSELFGKPLSIAVQVLYFDALQDLELRVVLDAMNTATRHSTFMPKPAELRKLAVGDSEDQAEAAWLAMKTAMGKVGAYDSLIVRDPALGETLLALFGSWPAACRADFSDEMWTAKRKEFGRIYRVMRQRGITAKPYLAGLVEEQNTVRAEWVKYARLGVIELDGTVRILEPGEAEQERAQLAFDMGLGRLRS